MKYIIDIEEFCLKNHLQQKDLAEISGLKPTFISAIKSGKSKFPQDRIQKIIDSGKYDTSMIKVIKEDDEITLNKDVLAILARQAETIQSQQETIRSQQETIRNLRQRLGESDWGGIIKAKKSDSYS